MTDRIHRSRSVPVTLALLISLGALAGCKSGGGGASEAPAPSAPATSNPAEPASQPASANRAPTISGAPMTEITASAAYTFAPSATDADSDPLTFQIQNKPSWATFNTTTGQLAGMPQAGTYANIVISTSDGAASATLPAFSIVVRTEAAASPSTGAATLSWTAPTQNVDGSALSDLAGYVIVFGTSRTVLSQTIRIDNVSIDRYVLEQLSPGTYYFGIKAYTRSGAESEVSPLVTKVI